MKQMTLAEAARTYPRDWAERSEDLVITLPDSGAEYSLGDLKCPRDGSVRAEVCFATGVQSWMTFPADYTVCVYT